VDLLVDHLKYLRDAFNSTDTKNYRAQMEKEELSESLRKIFTGVITLSADEMAGERGIVPIELKDQEHEQSCFSDTSLEDHLGNQLSVEQVVLGKYRSTLTTNEKMFEGAGLINLIEKNNGKLAKKIRNQLNESRMLMEDLLKKGKTLDQIILLKDKDPLKKLYKKILVSFEKQAKLLGVAGSEMGLLLNY
jgi:putative iron-regulated protein